MSGSFVRHLAGSRQAAFWQFFLAIVINLSFVFKTKNLLSLVSSWYLNWFLIFFISVQCKRQRLGLAYSFLLHFSFLASLKRFSTPFFYTNHRSIVFFQIPQCSQKLPEIISDFFMHLQKENLKNIFDKPKVYYGNVNVTT